MYIVDLLAIRWPIAPDLKSDLESSGNQADIGIIEKMMRAAPDGGLLHLYRKAIVIRRNLSVTF